jgi:uncharacterized protein
MPSTTIVFAKVPILGQVKTRIGLIHGTKLALDIYHELLGITAKTVKCLDHHIAFAGSNGPETLKSVFPNAQSFFSQSGKELGERLKNAFLHILDNGYGGICAIGCDCPALSADDISQSFNLLEKNDVVMGPASDGGYYLIACTPDALAVFDAKTWGTADLLAETLEICGKSGFRYALLKEKRDIDTIEDFNKWQNEM